MYDVVGLVFAQEAKWDNNPNPRTPKPIHNYSMSANSYSGFITRIREMLGLDPVTSKVQHLTVIFKEAIIHISTGASRWE